MEEKLKLQYQAYKISNSKGLLTEADLTLKYILEITVPLEITSEKEVWQQCDTISFKLLT